MLTITNNGSILDGALNDAINIDGGSGRNLGRLEIVNNNLVSVGSESTNARGSAIYVTQVGQVKITNSGLDDSILGTYAGIHVRNVGPQSSAPEGFSEALPVVQIVNGGNISGDVGVFVEGVSGTNARTGDVVITNNVGASIVGNGGVGVATIDVEGAVRITNSGTIDGSGTSVDLSVNNTPYAIRLETGDYTGAGIAVHGGLSSASASEVVIDNFDGTIIGNRQSPSSLGFFGVYAVSEGDISVNTSGIIQGDGAEALFLRSNNPDPASRREISVAILEGGVVQDELWGSNQTQGASARVITADSVGDVEITISSGGVLRGSMGLTSSSGSVSVENRGLWQVAGVGGSVTNAFSSSASSGGVTLENRGVIEIFGNANISLGSGTGTLLNEGGTIDLTADASPGLAPAFSTLTISGNFSGTSLNGGDQSTIVADVDISNPSGSPDQVVITGSVDGRTALRLIDTNETTPGVNDPEGRILVTSNLNNQPAGAFYIEGGPINKGLWEYDLYVTSGSTNWRLASAPSEHAHELPVLQSAAQEAWHQGAAAWLDHTNNVRMRLEEGNAVKGGAWARIVGADIERKNVNRGTQSEYGTAYSHQNNYEQDIYGVMFGADGAIELANGGTWLLGLTAGVTQSKVNFTTSTTDMDYTAGSVGAYASFVRGGGFFNALLKADMGSTDYKMSNGNGISANESFQTSAFGVMLDGGYRFRSGVAFIEPSVSVASVSAKIKDKEFLATNVDFSNGTSLRTKLTLATGFSAAWGGTRFEPYLALSAVHESDGENEVSLTSGGINTPVQVKDKQVETYGQVGLGLKVVGAKGSSGFLKVEHAPSASDNDTTKGDAKREATTVSAGVKLTW